MAEYIKKSIAIAIISNSADLYPFEKNQAIHRIEVSPAADVAPVVHGRWKPYHKNLGKCSECGEVVQIRSNYCPDCGAKMDLTED